MSAVRIPSCVRLRTSVRAAAPHLLALALLQVLLALLALQKGQAAFSALMSLYLPLAAAVGTFCIACAAFGADLRLALCTGVLQEIGAALQCILGAVSVRALTAQLAVSVCGALALCAAYERWSARLLQAPWLPWAACGGTGALYLALLVLGTTVSGTRAWLRIGGLSVQLTEFVKLFALLFWALVLTDGARSLRHRYLLALGFLAANAAALMLINELGTLLLLCLTFAALCALTLPGRFGLCNALGAGGALGLGALAAALVTRAADAMGTVPEGLFYMLWRVCRKVADRVAIAADPGADAYGAGYQALAARRAVLLGGALGSRYKAVNVPVGESDYVFPVLILHMGCLFAAAVVFVFLLTLIFGARGALRSASAFEQAAGVGCSVMIFCSMLVPVAGSLGFVPMSGIPMSFIAAGGTAQLTASMMVWLTALFGASRRAVPAPPAPARKECAACQTDSDFVIPIQL